MSSIRSLLPLLARTISTRLVQMSLGNFVPVFMLHRLDHPDYGITGQDPADIRRCLEIFRRQGYRPLSLQQLGEHIRDGESIPYKSAVFTIDDGFIDHHDIAAPLFAGYDIPLTFFLVTDFIDGKLWPWDNQVHHILHHAMAGTYGCTIHGQTLRFTLDDVSSRHHAVAQLRELLKANDNSTLYDCIKQLYHAFGVEQPDGIPVEHTPMDWQQANALASAGHCIAAHTCTHRILSQLGDDDASGEIRRSIEMVRSRVGHATDTFAYPTGRVIDFTAREASLLDEMGIIAAVSTVAEPFIPGHGTSGETCHRIPRFAMPSSTIDFIQYLSWIEFIKHKIRS